MRSTCLQKLGIAYFWLIQNLLRYFSYISVVAECSNFQFGKQLGFAKDLYQNTIKKVYVARDREAPQNLPSATVEASDFIFGKQLVLPRRIIKTDPWERCACHWVSIAYQKLGVQIQILHSARIRQAHH